MPDLDTANFHATYQVSIDLNEYPNWLESYKKLNKVEMVIRSSKKNNPLKIYTLFRCNFQKDYHKNKIKKNPVKISKFSECPCSLSTTLRKKSDDADEFNMSVTVKYGHNHFVNCADFLRFRTPFIEVKEKFLNLYEKGHTASSALKTHIHDIEEEYLDESYKYLGDGAYTPDQQMC